MRRGFTLLEMVLSVGLFALLSVVVFAFFRSAVNQFKMGASRGDLQTEARRVTALLRKEMARSSLDSVNLFNSSAVVGTSTVPRDRVSFATLKDWTDTSNFDATNGLPLWNQQMMFAVDQTTPNGNFGYAVVVPTDPAASPWSSLDSIAVPPPAGPQVLRWTSLSHSVRSLAVKKDGGRFSFDLQLAGKSLDTTRREEKLQLKFLLIPYNP